MAYTYVKVSLADTQPPIVAELKAIFEALPDDELLKALRGPNRRGRPGFDPKILWHCYLVRYVLGLPSVSALIRTIQDNPFIARACGVESPDQLPSQPTFSRFITKLSRRFYRTKMKDVMREMTRTLYATLPDFGKNVGIDSTDIKAWTSKSKKPTTDPDARWAVKSSVGNLRRYWLGYKVHMLADLDYEMPISMVVTSANVHDIRGATRVLSAARFTYKRFLPRYVMADAGYTSHKLRTTIKKHYRAEALIRARKTEKRALALQTPEWHYRFRKRVAIERIFSRLKEHRAFNKVTVQRIQKVTVHCFLGVIVLQAQAIATQSRVSVRKVA